MKKYFIGFLIACIFWVILLSFVDAPTYKVYDCGMAEWHPDIPLDVREECRKRKSKEWKEKREITT